MIDCKKLKKIEKLMLLKEYELNIMIILDQISYALKAVDKFKPFFETDNIDELIAKLEVK